MSKRLVQILIAGCAAAFVVAGCGSSGGDTSTASLTKAEFVKRADAICAKGNKQLQVQVVGYAKKVGWSGKTPPTDAQATEIASTILIPSVQSQHDKIDALGAPSGEEDQVNAILTALQDAIDQAKKDPAALVRQPHDPTFTKADKLAQDYGLTVCGQG